VAPNRPLRRDPIDLAAENWAARGWEAASPGMAAVTSVMRVQQIMLRDVEAVLRPLGLTFARYEVLMLLGFSRTGSLPVGKMGERLQVHPASVTNAVDRLERDGYVLRRPNPADGRGVLAELTGAGRALADRATAILNAEVFSGLPLDDRELGALYRILRKLRQASGDFE
jgi:DNA-binding MarR family transcriptional regulator